MGQKGRIFAREAHGPVTVREVTALDQTGYGAVRRVHRGALDRTFPAPYSPNSALCVGNHCFGPRAQVPPLWAKTKVPKRWLSSTSDGDGRGGCPKGPGHRGGHGPSRVCGGCPCVARGPLAVPPNAASRRPRAERPHAEGREFRPGAFPESTTPMDLPGGRWVDLSRQGLEM